ncbi:MAG TPA: dTDP-4-dehydrorhamnose 3,5-epimerase [Syntrophales bacterium]|nr:dTDP-4-dehydrorhamnose 3,5-epimerase [Syntrophales bacterium]
MAAFQFIETPIEDLLLIETEVFADSRGSFQETFRQDAFSHAGISLDFVQDNQSRSIRNVLRGLHFQRKKPQGKLVRAVLGEIYDVAVDLRQDSSTYGQWHGVRLSRENRRQFYLPPGFAHGFLTLSREAIVLYRCTDYYDGQDQGGICWNDPTLNIQWPLSGEAPILSDKDLQNQTFAAYQESTK